MIRSPRAIQLFFGASAVLCAVLLIAALLADVDEKAGLATVGALALLGSLASASLAPRVIRWESGGGRRWDQR